MLSLFALLSGNLHAPQFPLTVESIMRGPALVGHAPRRLRWSADGVELRFEWAKADRELCLAISEVGEISYLKSTSRTPVDEGPLELAKLNALIDWLLYGR